MPVQDRGADQQRLQISDLDKFPTPTTFACWKIRFQNWGTYLFTISYGSYAMDQRSGDGWISGWSQNFRVLSEELLGQTLSCSTRELLQHWTKSSRIPRFKKKGQSGGNESSKRRPLPPWKTDRFPDLRVLPGYWGQRCCRELRRLVYSCSSKWWYSGIRFKLGRNSIIDDKNPNWWHLAKLVQIKNTESLRNSRPCWNCTIWRFNRRRLHLIITDWRQW